MHLRLLWIDLLRHHDCGVALLLFLYADKLLVQLGHFIYNSKFLSRVTVVAGPVNETIDLKPELLLVRKLLQSFGRL